MPSCTHCSSAFDITKEDLVFYEKISPVFNGKKELIPPPTLCPPCRQQRRLAHSNESQLYHRKCDLTGRQIISVYSQDKPLKVYEPREWWSDKWDPKDYGREFDFDRPFFDQFTELRNDVPHLALLVDGNENSDYVNYSGWDKNCYLCFCVDYSEDCYYCHDTYYSKNSVDCFFGYELEICYECVGCKKCHRLFHSQNCSQCSDGWYLFDCTDCRNCFGCTGLRHKEYHWFNEQISKDEYEKRMREFLALPREQRKKVWNVFMKLLLAFPHREMEGTQNENVLGNYLFNCKNAFHCYDSTDLEDCKFCMSTRGAKDCHDIDRWGKPAELSYECLGLGERATGVLFSYYCWNGDQNLLYCVLCHKSSDCFGCIGMRNARYCILNKQYTKEEYEALMPKIIEHMRKTSEWGEYFPASMSVFGYGETVADEYFPLAKEDVLKRGWNWHDDKERENYLGPKVAVPEHINDVEDSICEKILICETTGKPYKVIPQELAFYREHGIPLPRICPDRRYRDRVVLRNPQKLWKRECAKCKKEIQTTYAPERPEIVYCEQCYLANIY